MNINTDRISLPLKKICKTGTARPKPGNRNRGTETGEPELGNREQKTGSVRHRSLTVRRAEDERQ